jgi:16S rRNA (uracil1498-N3)-methyltransferase
MQRYFVETRQFQSDSVKLMGEDAHHVQRVMRMKAGDRIIVSDGAGREALAVIRTLAQNEVEADLEEELPMTGEPKWSVTIAQSLPKGDKMETVIQKGTEIGAAAFQPFQSERMIVHYDDKKEQKRIERWRKIAKEAAEQAHRSVIPAIAPVMSWRQLMAAIPAYDAAFLCYEKEGGSASAGLRSALQAVLREQPPGKALKLLLIVGPEGGFTEREAAEAGQAGARIVGLGRRILRTETAGMVGLACLLYEAGEMGGNE